MSFTPDPTPWPLPERYEVVEHQFLKRGHAEIGYLNVAYFSDLPFDVKRIFWVTKTPPNVLRGGHAHFQTQQLLVAVSGIIEVKLGWPDGSSTVYTASDPSRAVYIPPYAWHEMTYSTDSVQLVLASTPFDERDYIRNKHNWARIYGMNLQAQSV